MGIQYVTVKVDTSGLFQPLASAGGIVGIIGASPSAGPGFSNPTLFTRPLTGASGEPYARVVPVLKIAPLANDVQTLSVTGNPTGGTFKLSFNSQTTGAIPYNATSDQVQAALVALGAIGAGNVACQGGPLPTPVTITFQGAKAFAEQQPITVAANDLSGGTNSAPSLAHTTSGSAQRNDVQTLSMVGNPTGGGFTLIFGGQTTAKINYNAEASKVQAALEALASIGAGNVICDKGPLPQEVTITFQNALGYLPQAAIVAGPSDLKGPAPAITHTTPGAAGTNEIQALSLTGSPSGGDFTLGFGGQTTTKIAFNAKASDVQAALSALSNVGAGNIACTDGPLPASSVTIKFLGTLGLSPQALITSSSSSLSGGTSPAVVVTRTTAGSLHQNDIQTLSIAGSPSGGTFALNFAGSATTDIPFNATAAQVQAALSALPGIGASNVACDEGPLPKDVRITFQGNLGFSAQSLIAVGSNDLTTNVDPSPVVAHTTKGIGTTSLVTPVDAENTVIPNLRWDPLRFVLMDATTNAPLSVDVVGRRLRYQNGSAFQNGTEDADIELQGFSIVSCGGPASFWGVPLDKDGQPVANLLMRPDVPPCGAFVDFARNVLPIDGTLGTADKGSGRPKGVNGSVYYKVTFDICSLARSINLALTNGALQVWGYRLDPPPVSFDATAAYADFTSREINIVCLSYNSDPDHITELKNHVEIEFTQRCWRWRHTP